MVASPPGQKHSTEQTSDVQLIFRAAVHHSFCITDRGVKPSEPKAEDERYELSEPSPQEPSEDHEPTNSSDSERTAWRNFVAVPRNGRMSLISGPAVTPYSMVLRAALKPLRRPTSSSSDLPDKRTSWSHG